MTDHGQHQILWPSIVVGQSVSGVPLTTPLRLRWAAKETLISWSQCSLVSQLSIQTTADNDTHTPHHSPHCVHPPSTIQ